MLDSRIRTLMFVPCYLWVAPWTILGLLVGLICKPHGVEFAKQRGTLGIFGPGVASLLRKVPIAGGAKAMTLGHCILAVDRESWRETFSHEWIHVKQYQWFGPLFVPAYFIESAWQWVRGRDPYRDNRFEKQAYQWE
ncbi:MAG: hypothetical protein ACK5T6_14660 [Pirellula sp.]